MNHSGRQMRSLLLTGNIASIASLISRRPALVSYSKEGATVALSPSIPTLDVSQYPLSRKTPGVRRAKERQGVGSPLREIQVAPKCPLHVGANMVFHEVKGLVADPKDPFETHRLVPGTVRYFRCPIAGCYRVEPGRVAEVSRVKMCTRCGVNKLTGEDHSHCRPCVRAYHNAHAAELRERRKLK